MDRRQLLVMILFSVGWLVAILTIPALVWAQLLQAATGWMGGVVLVIATLLVGLGLFWALVGGGRGRDGG